MHNYTRDITATRPENFAELSEEEKALIKKLGVYIKEWTSRLAASCALRTFKRLERVTTSEIRRSCAITVCLDSSLTDVESPGFDCHL